MDSQGGSLERVWAEPSRGSPAAAIAQQSCASDRAAGQRTERSEVRRTGEQSENGRRTMPCNHCARGEPPDHANPRRYGLAMAPKHPDPMHDLARPLEAPSDSPTQTIRPSAHTDATCTRTSHPIKHTEQTPPARKSAPGLLRRPATPTHQHQTHPLRGHASTSGDSRLEASRVAPCRRQTYCSPNTIAR